MSQRNKLMSCKTKVIVFVFFSHASFNKGFAKCNSRHKQKVSPTGLFRHVFGFRIDEPFIDKQITNPVISDHINIFV